MAKFRSTTSNFSKGEFSPKLYGRTNLQHYYNAVKQLENLIILPQGGVTRTEGKRYIAEVKNSAKKTVLIPFEFSTEQAYILEFGDQYIRFYKDLGQIISGMAAYEIVSPYLEADLAQIQYAQTADVMYLVHSGYEPRVLTRTGHTAWTLNVISWVYPPMRADNTKVNPNGHTMTPSAATGNGITITSSANFFTTNMVNGFIRVKDGFAKIVGYTSATVVTADVKKDLGGTSATDLWAIGAFSAEYGYPGAVTLYEQRLALASTKGDADGVWLSIPEQFENFERGEDDDDSLLYDIAQKKVNKIEWLEPTSELAMGTSGGPFNMSSGSDDLALTPGNIRVRQQNTCGATTVVPQKIGTAIYYVERNGRKIRQYEYNIDRNIFKSIEISILSEHIFRKGVKQMAYQQTPYSVLWCVLNDGSIATMTREEDQELFGWSRQFTDGEFESVAVIPSSDKSYDQVWFVIKRTINGQTKRYIEALGIPFDYIDDQKDAFFVDCGLTYSGAPATVISGLSHLEGKTVQVLADGAAKGEYTVTGGQITLDKPASKVHVGLKYISKLKALPVEIPNEYSAVKDQPKSPIDVSLMFYRTLGAKYGREGKEKVIPFRNTNDATGVPPPLFTGHKREHLEGWDKDQELVALQDLPLPFTLLATTIEQEV